MYIIKINIYSTILLIFLLYLRISFKSFNYKKDYIYNVLSQIVNTRIVEFNIIIFNIIKANIVKANIVKANILESIIIKVI